VEKIFAHESERHRGRLKLYTLKRFSGLTSTVIAHRYGRRHSAVTMAVKAIEAEASKSPALANHLAPLGEPGADPCC
jgi:chromosomal replication initiation ATPase DnaA